MAMYPLHIGMLKSKDEKTIFGLIDDFVASDYMQKLIKSKHVKA